MLYRGYCIHREVRDHDATWVAPFGNPGIIARWQLPQAYRSLLRPSSPVVPRYPPCALMYLLRRFFRNTIFEIAARGSSPRTRSHVWHMKVLLYAVFKVRGSVIGAPAIASNRANRERPMFGPSKLNSAVPTNTVHAR